MAFTLVEVLVVITIVSILAAMLLPVLIQARSAAIRTSCASNMRQMYIGLASYADDNGYFIPPVGVSDLPTRMYCTHLPSSITSDFRGLQKYWPGLVALCPGFARTPYYKQYRTTRFRWTAPGYNWLDIPKGTEVPTTNAVYLGYNVIHGSHLAGEIVSGKYAGDSSVRWGRDYPCSHSKGLWNNLTLFQCLSNNGNNISPYWQWFLQVAYYPWASFSHDPGRPQGMNWTAGDGRVKYVGLDKIFYEYSGWATVKPWGNRNDSY